MDFGCVENATCTPLDYGLLDPSDPPSHPFNTSASHSSLQSHAMPMGDGHDGLMGMAGGLLDPVDGRYTTAIHIYVWQA